MSQGAANAAAVGGQFNTSAPVPVNGQVIPLQLDSAGNLLVNVAVGGGGGGSNASVGTTGANVPASATYIGADNPGGKLTGLAVDASGNLLVNIAAGSSSGVQFADNAASGATPTGTLAMGWDSTNSKIRALKVDATQDLFVAFSGAQHVIVDSVPAVDVTDRAARLLGVVYGSQGQQIKQTATNFNLQVELATGGTLYDARQIRALTSADVVTANQGMANATPWNENIAQVGGSAVSLGAKASASSIPVVLATDEATLNVSVQNATLAVTQSTSPWVTSDNHFPASVALADNLANPTTTEIGANMLGWDATNTVWRRVQVDAATGTLKVDGSGSTQPVSGTVTANQGGAPWSVTLPAGQAVELLDSGGTNKASISAAGAVKVDGSAVTQPVSIAATVNVSVQNATLAVTQSTSPWVENVSQFGGSSVVTGTGVSGAGIPRITVSSDSFPATQAVVGLDTVNKLSATNPVQVGGVDNLGIVRQLALDDAGNLAGEHQDFQLVVRHLNFILQALNNLNAQLGAMPVQIS